MALQLKSLAAEISPMPALSYNNFDAVAATPEVMLDFALKLRDGFEVSGARSLAQFMEKEVSVAGKPMKSAAFLYNLSTRDLFLDELPAAEVMHAHKASEIFRKLDPSWDITEFLADQSLCEKLKQTREAASRVSARTADLAQRSVAHLGAIASAREHRVIATRHM